MIERLDALLRAHKSVIEVRRKSGVESERCSAEVRTLQVLQHMATELKCKIFAPAKAGDGFGWKSHAMQAERLQEMQLLLPGGLTSDPTATRQEEIPRNIGDLLSSRCPSTKQRH